MPSLKYYNGSAWVSIDPEITNGSAKARLAIDRVGVGKLATYYPYLELSDSSLSNGSTKYYKDKIAIGSSIINFPSFIGTKTLALTSDIKHVYRHICTVYISYCPYTIIFYNTSNSGTSLYNIMQHAIGQVLSNQYNIGEMLGINSVIQNGSYVQINAEHYYKNNSNYMVRALWSNVDVSLEEESIDEV